jgi:acetolactate synthase-1/2/3 large subunit
VVDVPKDVQTETVEVDVLPEPGRPDPPPEFSGDQIARAVALIDAARRPVILAGAGVIAAAASRTLRRLSEKASIPVAVTLLGLGALPHDHPLFLGMAGMHAARWTNLLLEECDLVIGLGVRFDDRATGKAAEFCPRAKLLHIDIDDSELGKIKQPCLGIVADVGEALRAIEPLVAAASHGEWIQRMLRLRAAHPLSMCGADDPLRAYGIVRQTAALVAGDTVVATDVGQHQMWVAQAYPFSRPRQWLTSGGLGTMGFGLPAAIGAALALPGRTVVCFSGDGSLLMNLQELATAAEEGVSVKVVLLNNAQLGLVRQQQQLFYGGRYHASHFHAEPDFAAIARGFGVVAYNLGEAADPLATLARALDAPGPCLVNVPIGAEENVYPMVVPGGANRDMIGGETDASDRV